MSKLTKALKGLILLGTQARVFNPIEKLVGKRVAVIGPASSLFTEAKGQYIDGFDYVFRINKAIVNWQDENEPYTGKRTDILFHSFFENSQSGGGKLDFALFKSKGIQYVINPRNNYGGWRLIFNFYKKYLISEPVYTLPRDFYHACQAPFGELKPTIGFTGLYTALMSPCAEVYISGFTFFKTPYSKGYRDDLVDLKANEKHIADQGIHDPELEFSLFLKMITEKLAEKLIMDQDLTRIVKQELSK